MPGYSYVCGECEEEFSIWHSMGEVVCDCPQEIICGAKNSLTKIPSLAKIIVKDGSAPVGKRVEEFIDDSRQELKQFKEELENKR